MNRLKLETDLWKIFSWYIRLKNSVGGYASCVTCSRTFPVKQMDAGHFITRIGSKIKFDERNVHPQCQDCNRTKSEKVDQEFERFMIQQFGQEVVDELRTMKHEIWKPDLDVLLKFISHYKDKVRMLEENYWPPL